MGDNCNPIEISDSDSEHQIPSTSRSNKNGNTSNNINGPSTSTSNKNGNISNNKNENNSTEVTKSTKELQKVSSELLDSYLYHVENNEPDYDWKKTKLKIRNYFNNLDEKFKHSEKFRNFLKYQLELIQNQPKETLQSVIHLKDDLRSNQKINLNDDEDRYKLRKIQKLENILYKLNRYIKKYETAEIDFSKEEDCNENSYYIKLERFKERFVQVHKKLCSLKKEQPVRGISLFHVEVDHTPFRELNEEIEQQIFKKKKFPDFKDIYNIIEDYNKNNNLNLNSSEIMIHAKNIFESVGLQIKRRRCFDFYQNMGSLLRDQVETDPADIDQQLANKLKENAKIFKNKLSTIIQKYAHAQNTKQIVPQEISDNCTSSEGEGDKEDDDDRESINNLDKEDIKSEDEIELLSDDEKEKEESAKKENNKHMVEEDKESDNDILEIEEIHLKTSPMKDCNKTVSIKSEKEINAKSKLNDVDYASGLKQRVFVDCDTLEVRMGEKTTKIEEINLNECDMKLNDISTNSKIEEIEIDSDTEAPPPPLKQISISTKKITQFFTRVDPIAISPKPPKKKKKKVKIKMNPIAINSRHTGVMKNNFKQDPIGFTTTPKDSSKNNNYQIVQIAIPIIPMETMNNKIIKIDPFAISTTPMEPAKNSNIQIKPNAIQTTPTESGIKRISKRKQYLPPSVPCKITKTIEEDDDIIFLD